ncbi:membrane protein [Actinoplanes italicus]|uniref:FtsX-like permease family protein n=1 Tax=Actinoplanes italicus TaxID=113567 RepID=A0A2T0K9L3_9ACTN|nr:ABC transporter permease [Actinoplanes italicus]PRX19476.1 FtsX-like permease family protein [Actinoplanes italicus]GIE30509.1 membrane protein [Actinoplanes italicus]
MIRGPRRWLFELGLGARMSVAGGRAGWFRLGLIAIGVGLGVAVLLGAATVPAAIAASNARTDARAIDNFDEDVVKGDDTLLVSRTGTTFGDYAFSGEMLQAEGSRPPLPPGVTRFPGPGEMVVSPELDRLMREPGNALLRERWDAEVIGVIGDEGLSGPAELFFYLGTDTLSAEDGDPRIEGFGDATIEQDVVPIFVLLTLVGMVVLLIPVMVFMASAVRFGDQSRDRRLAALRLVGADAAMTRRIAAGETLAGAVVGLLIGGLLWVGEILLANRYGTGALSFYLSDLRPVPLLVAVIVVGVPVVAVLVTLSAMRRVVVEPLGVTRMSVTVRRRLWWRLILPLVGLGLLWPLYQGIDGRSDYEAQVVAGMAFLLVGISLLLPWLVEAVVRRLGGGSPAWELAVRRLQFDSGTAVRSVSGIAVSVAGVLAMQGIVTGIESLYNGSGSASAVRYGMEILPGTDLPERTWTAALDSTPGVLEYQTVRMVRAGDDATLRIGSCPVLQQFARLGECRDGDVFALDGAAPGATYTLGESGSSWTSPATTRVVDSKSDVPASGATVLVTPSAISGVAVKPDNTYFYVALDPGAPQAVEHLRNTAVGLDLQAYVFSYANSTVRDALAGMRDALLVGSIALLFLIGASMIVNVAEQLRERRKVLAVLVAFGTRRRTLSGSVLYQVAIPVALGMILAVSVGTLLATILMVAVDAPLTVDWFGIGTTSAIAAIVVLGTTAAGLPALWRLTRPGNLRSE